MLRHAGKLAVAVALVVVIGGCGSKTVEQSTEPRPTDLPTYDIGEPTESGGWAMQAKSVERMTEAGGTSAASGQELLVITLEVKNGADSDRELGTTSFMLTGPDGVAYQAAQATDPSYISSTAQSIKAGETRELKIAYSVPVGTTPLQWSFMPSSPDGAAEAIIVTLD